MKVVECIGGPHDGILMEVPADGESLEFLDGASYVIDGAEARFQS